MAPEYHCRIAIARSSKAPSRTGTLMGGSFLVTRNLARTAKSLMATVYVRPLWDGYVGWACVPISAFAAFAFAFFLALFD
jgi:hypothetical protein